MNKFLSSYKLVRNNQGVGLIPPPEVSVGSSRANGMAYTDIMLVQCEVAYCPVSNQTNHQDRIAQIQKNKNQHDGSTIPKNLTRLIKAIKKKKFQEIWKYFDDLIQALYRPIEQEEEHEEEQEEVVQQREDTSAPNILETFAQIAEDQAAENAEPLEEVPIEETPADEVPAPIDVSAHRKGCVNGEEFINLLESITDEFDVSKVLSDPLSIEIYNKINQWRAMRFHIE
jgi:hypothetical protein